jgi:IS30 family transposase
MYKADTAEKEYITKLHESREGFNLSEDELLAIDAFYSPMISHGQSVYHINISNINKIPCSDSTVYRLIHANAITARPIDMPRMCRLKPRKGVRPYMKIDKSCTSGRKYEDLLAYLEAHPGTMVSEMDSVEGRRGGKVLLTIILTNCNFMLAFIRDRNTAQSVIDCFNWLYDNLPRDVYSHMFYILKGDNGTEFSNPTPLEFDMSTGKQRSHVFYCHPNAPFEKPHVENNHELLRRIIPKGTSFDHLDQNDINFIMSNINSYGRNVYNGVSPTELFISIYGKDVLHLLGQELIESKNIILKPDLLR